MGTEVAVLVLLEFQAGTEIVTLAEDHEFARYLGRHPYSHMKGYQLQQPPGLKTGAKRKLLAFKFKVTA